jgi:ubiquinone/menaquinone biosynthesis C-methylase UbiE
MRSSTSTTDTSASPDRRARYVPALRFRLLTRLYDPAVRLTTREKEFKRRLLGQARIEPDHRVLDLGCGTGTLAAMAKSHVPGAELVGLDGDPEVLERAREKTDVAGVEIRFDEGFSTELPYEDSSFDRVLSTLFFHHLTGADKRRTAEELARVIRPGGELHVADLGRPADPLMWALVQQVRVFDGVDQTRDNVAGTLPEIFRDAGLADARERDRLRTPVGTISLYSASQPSG